MKNEKFIEAFHDLLTQWESEKKPADLLFRQYCRKNHFLGAKDRQALGSLFFESLVTKCFFTTLHFAVLCSSAIYLCQIKDEKPNKKALPNINIFVTNVSAMGMKNRAT